MTSFRRREPILAPLVLVAPPLALFALLIIWPVMQSVTMSFYDWDGSGGQATWVGLGNYTELMADFQFFTSMKNNLIWIAMFLFAPIMGLMLALFLNQELVEMRFVKSVFFVPLVLGNVIIGVIFTWVYDPTFGILALLIQQVGFQPVAILSDENLVTFGIVVAALWPQTSFCLVLFLAGLSQLDKDQIEAGRLDGASGPSLLRYIVWPQLKPVAFVALIVSIIGSLRNFDFISVMTQGGPYGSSTVLAYQMYESTIVNYRAGYGSAIATVLLLMMCVFIGWFLVITLRGERKGR